MRLSDVVLLTFQGCYDKLEETVKTKAILVLSLMATAFGFQVGDKRTCPIIIVFSP